MSAVMGRTFEATLWALGARGLTAPEWRVLVMLARKVGKRGYDVWPKHKTLARDCEMGVTTVRRALKVLEDQGFIEILERYIPETGDRTSNLYRLQVRQKLTYPSGVEVETGPDDEDDEPSIPPVQIGHGSRKMDRPSPPERTDPPLSGGQVEELGPLELDSDEENPPSPNGEDTPIDESDLFGRKAVAHVFDEPMALWMEVEDRWMAMCMKHGGISAIGAMTPSRKKKIEARANEVVRDAGRKGEQITPLQVWERIFAAIPRSTFLLGKAPPGKGYTKPMRLSIDYVLQQKVFLNILVGGFDDDERYRNREFDAASGRTFSPAEAATRGALSRLGSLGARRDDRGNPRGPERGNEGGAAGSSSRLPDRGFPVSDRG